ncbi:adenylosuccinate lyase family protein [uncultured Alsobacter sp.]|uniref:class-II fumarase/aspartase family protein n=1 Tax=uncultured Alsobacter sp. TaxID=1748258 RepID=UPI0025CD11C0|nr:adenylosuccinate lyase family protein [uncultured Alsobacter sp.]
MAFSPLDSDILAPLTTTAAMRAVFSEAARLAAMLRTEAALARAEAGLGLAPAGLAPAIEAIDPASLDLVALGKGTGLAGVPVIPFVKAVQARLPKDLEASFHKGATTQDIADTGLVLQMRDAFSLLRTDGAAVLSGLSALADRHSDAPCAGRTYGQHGAPLTFGYKAAVWLAGIADVLDRLPEIETRVLTASLAGPVGTLAGLRDKGPAVVEAFARELGLAAPPIAWHARRAAMAEAGSWLAMLCGALGKMATDVANLASTEVGEVAEPYVPGRGGSSAMPHKRNPVSATVILSAAEASAPLASTMIASMVACHERPAGAWHAEWHALPTLFGLAAGALAEARRLAEGLEVDTARMRANLDITRGLLFADAAAAVMARSAGRGAAHALVEEAAGEVRSSGRHLLDVLADRPDLPAGIDRAALAAAFDLSPAVAAASQWIDPVREAAARVATRLLQTT